MDVVVVGYYYGRGARASWGIGSLLCAVYDPENDTFPTVTRCASGLSNQGWIALGPAAGAGPHRAPRPARGEHPQAGCLGGAALRVRAAGRRGDAQPHAPGRERGGRTGLRPALPAHRAGAREAADDATTVAEVLDLYRMQGHKGESGKRAARGRKPAEAAPEEA